MRGVTIFLLALLRAQATTEVVPNDYQDSMVDELVHALLDRGNEPLHEQSQLEDATLGKTSQLSSVATPTRIAFTPATGRKYGQPSLPASAGPTPSPSLGSMCAVFHIVSWFPRPHARKCQ
jgi:hypothetical protein